MMFLLSSLLLSRSVELPEEAEVDSATSAALVFTSTPPEIVVDVPE